MGLPPTEIHHTSFEPGVRLSPPPFRVLDCHQSAPVVGGERCSFGCIGKRISGPKFACIPTVATDWFSRAGVVGILKVG